MRGLEERLRLALEGTETGFWEWYVDTDVVEWSDNMGPLYGLPRGTQPAGRRRLPRPHRAPRGPRADRPARPGRARARHAVRDRPARRAARQGPALAARPRPRGAAADGRTERITGLLSDVTERRQREEAHAFLDAASQVLAASMDPVRDARGGRAARRPARWRTGARCSSRPTRPALRAGRRRPRRPREGALGARAAGALPARPRRRRPARPP